MINIIYCPEGDALSEFVAEEHVSNMIKAFKQNNFFRGVDKEVKFSTELPIQCFVYEVMSGSIPEETISFWDQDNLMEFSMVKGLAEQEIKHCSMTKYSDIYEYWD